MRCEPARFARDPQHKQRLPAFQERTNLDDARRSGHDTRTPIHIAAECVTLGSAAAADVADLSAVKLAMLARVLPRIAALLLSWK